MRLKSLELAGFKTFPNKTLLSFDDGITVVVGPNGSGKSNISDAMRWVLGEQSLRTLRCSKMEDVIFSGTPNLKAKPCAAVSLAISNDEGHLQAGNETVTVTRRYYRSGESEYLINNRTVRLRDIHELLMDTGLGRDGYSIVSQGKIDSIIQSRSDDRREIFEEAAKISKCRYKKGEAVRQLTLAEENMVRLRDIAGELEARVGPLQKQAQKTMEFLELAQRKKALEVGLWVHKLGNLKQVQKKREADLAHLSARHSELEEEICSAAKTADLLSSKMTQTSTEINKTREEVFSKEAEIARKEGKISVCKNDILRGEELKKRAAVELLQLDEQTLDLEKRAAEKTDYAQGLEKEAIEKANVLKALKENLSTVEKIRAEHAQKKEDSVQEMLQFRALLAQEKAQNEIASASQKQLAERASTLEKKQENLAWELNLIQEKIKEILVRKNQKQQECAALSEEFSISNAQKETLAKTLQNLYRQNDDHNAQGRAVESKISFLRDLRQNLEGFSASVKFLMKEGINGVLGPVAQLLQVPKEYALAIETALGSAAQHLVVEAEADAKAAIARLKAKKIGRATFLPVETIKCARLDTKGIATLRGFVAVASDLCTYEARFTEILNSLLGRIVVAQNLDTATAIAQQTGYRVRVVSLDGQVVNAGGSLTGGAFVKNAGAFSRAAELTRFEADFKKLQQKKVETSNKIKEASVALTNTQALVAALEGKLSREKETLAEIEKELLSSRYDLAHTQKTANEQALELADLQEKLCKNTVHTGAKSFSEDELGRELAKLEANLQSLTEELARLEMQYHHLCKQVERAQIEEFSAQNAIKLAQNERTFLQERLAELAQRRTRLLEENSEEKNREKTAQHQIKSLGWDIAAANKEIDGARVHMQNLAEKQQKIESDLAQLRQTEREQRAEKERLALELLRLRDKCSEAETEHDEIITRLWDNYELTQSQAQNEFSLKIDTEPAKKELSIILGKIRSLGNVNVAAVEEYKEVSERLFFISGQILDIEQAKTGLLRLIDDLTQQMRTVFLKKFKEINLHFGEIFSELFSGGKAQLLLDNPQEPLTSGISISVQPPGKIVTQLESLSGGEKALTAIALYFAIFSVNPSPFCILDEIEASLDEANVARFALYLEKMKEHTQFIVVSHRRGTMEVADRLYGVTMQDEGVSQLLTLPENVKI